MYTFLKQGVRETLDAMRAGEHTPQSFLEAELMRFLKNPQPRFVWGEVALTALNGAPELERSANQARTLTRALKELVNGAVPEGELEAGIRVALIGRTSAEHARFWALRHDWTRAVPMLEREQERCAREVLVKCFVKLAELNQPLWDATRAAMQRTRDDAYRAQLQQVLNALSVKRAYGAASKAASYAEYHTLAQAHTHDLHSVLNEPAILQRLARLGGLQLPTEAELLSIAGVWLERIAGYGYFLRFQPAISPFQQVRELQEWYARSERDPRRRARHELAGTLSALLHSASASPDKTVQVVRALDAGFVNLRWRVGHARLVRYSAERDLKVEYTTRWYRHRAHRHTEPAD